jgi:hypothetical protein
MVVLQKVKTVGFYSTAAVLINLITLIALANDVKKLVSYTEVRISEYVCEEQQDVQRYNYTSCWNYRGC